MQNTPRSAIQVKKAPTPFGQLIVPQPIIIQNQQQQSHIQSQFHQQMIQQQSNQSQHQINFNGYKCKIIGKPNEYILAKF